jgi:hypothetical protein
LQVFSSPLLARKLRFADCPPDALPTLEQAASMRRGGG